MVYIDMLVNTALSPALYIFLLILYLVLHAVKPVLKGHLMSLYKICFQRTLCEHVQLFVLVLVICINIFAFEPNLHIS